MPNKEVMLVRNHFDQCLVLTVINTIATGCKKTSYVLGSRGVYDPIVTPHANCCCYQFVARNG